MSTSRISEHVTPNLPVAADSEPVAGAHSEEKKEVSRANHDANSVRTERWQAQANNERASDRGKLTEAYYGALLQNLQPGAKLKLSLGASISAGHEIAEVGGKSNVEIERLANGDYRVTMGGELLAEAKGHLWKAVELKEGVAGGAEFSWDFTSKESAADALSAIQQRAAKAGDLFGSDSKYDADVDERFQRLVNNPSAVSFIQKQSVGAKVDVALAEAGISAGADQKVTLDYFNKTVTTESTLKAEGSAAVGAKLHIGHVEIGQRMEVLNAEVKNTIRTTYAAGPETFKELANGEYGRAAFMAFGAPSKTEIVQQMSVKTPFGEASAKREVPIEHARDFAKLVDVGDTELEFVVRDSVKSKSEAEFGVLKVEGELEYESAPALTVKTTLKELPAVLTEQHKLNDDVAAHRALIGLRKD